MKAGMERHEIQKILACGQHTYVGCLGEMIVANLLRTAGYIVREMKVGEKCGDLKVINMATGEVNHVEVKTATQGKDRKWRFTLTKAGHTDHTNADFVILLAITRSGDFVNFVVPVEDLRNKRHAVITSNPREYAGRLAQYRQRGKLTLENLIN